MVPKEAFKTLGTKLATNKNFSRMPSNSSQVVNLVDDELLATAFGTLDGDALGNTEADLDRDEEVNFADDADMAQDSGVSGDK